MRVWLLLLACVTVPPGATSSRGSTGSATSTGAAPWTTPWTDQPCDALPEGGNFQADVDRFVAGDALAPASPGQLVVTGSSSIRRWETAFEALGAWGVVQRGLGGAQLWEIAGAAEVLITSHEPAAVLVFAGTNDIAFGRTADDVVRDFRCLVERVWARGDAPVAFVGITPTPARWDQWSEADAANDGILALADAHPGLGYVDVPAPFLATGTPPDASLFVDDGLHLSVEGYALWTETVLAALPATVAAGWQAPANPLHPDTGARVRVDLGPSNADDGTPMTGVDAFGDVWNAWHDTEGGSQVLAGEVLGSRDGTGQGLRDTTGVDTGLRLVVTGGFRSNGLQNGGLVAPDAARLGTLAVPEATQDYFYTSDPDDPAGLALVGLDPARSYTLRLFASRDSDEPRTTRYVVRGGHGQTEGLLATSGPGVGAGGGNANDDTVVELVGLRPDEQGALHLDVQLVTGTVAYLALVELEVGPAR